MKKIVQIFVILSILAVGTQIIQIPLINISIFQFFVFLALGIGLPFVFANGRKSDSLCLWMVLLWALTSLIALLTSINPQWAKSSFLVGIMTAMYFFIIPNLFERKDLPMLETWLIRSQYIVLPFSFYSFIIFYSFGTFPHEIMLPGGFHISIKDEILDDTFSSRELRMFLPYWTAPILSIIMAMCITLLLFCQNLFKSIYRWALIIIYGVIMVMTGSRSGIMGLLIFFVYLIVSGDIKYLTKKFRARNIIIGSVFLVLALIIAMQFDYFQEMILGRFSSVNRPELKDDRHFLVPLDGLLLWLDSLENFSFGIGFGSSALIQGAHTYLPPHFLNSFVTLIAERGLLGLIIVILLIKLLMSLLKLKRYMTKNEIALTYTYFVGLASSIFYESFNSYFVVFVISIVLLVRKEVKRSVEIKKKVRY